MHRVKKYALEIIGRYDNLFNDDFLHNKQALEQVGSFISKELRNEVAGYITSIMRKREKAPSTVTQESVSVKAEAVD